MIGRAHALAAACACLLAGCLAYHAGPLPGEPATAMFANVDGARIHYLELGEGPPVVLIHGFGASLESWRPILGKLAEHHHVLALDLKGFGWSDRPEGDYSPAAEARVVLDLMTARGIDRAAIVGQSWGGAIALSIVAAAPERVTRAAIYDGLAFESEVNGFMGFARLRGLGELMFWLAWDDALVAESSPMAFYDPKYVTADGLDALSAAMARPGATAAAYAVVHAIRLDDLETRYHAMRTPFLLLWGHEDRIVPRSVGERLARELPNAKLIEYPRCGHLVQVEAPRSTDDLIAFLDATAAATEAKP